MMKLGKVFCLFMLAMGLAVVVVPEGRADESSELILQLLIKKGIVSQADVDELKAEAAKQESPAPADIEERVTKLEQDIQKTPKLDSFLSNDMKIGGYIQTRYTAGPSKKVNDSLTINNAKIAISGKAVPEVFYKIELGPHRSPSSSILYDAFMRAEYFKKAKITMGQFKVPFSEEQLTSSSSIKTADRALFQGSLSNEYSVGVMADGDVLSNVYYAIAGVTGQDRSAADNNESKDVIGRLVYSPFEKSDTEIFKGLKLGTAVQAGRQPRSGNNEGTRLRNLGMVKYDYKGFSLLSEYVRQSQDQIPGLDDVTGEGWYAVFAYKFPFNFSKYKTELEPVFKIEQYDPDTDVGNDQQDMYTLGLTWYLNKYFYLMANYQIREEQNEASNDRFILQSQIKF